MPKYIIERAIPGSGKLSAEELKEIAKASCNVVRNLVPDVQWVQSYVTDDKWYCVYVASSEDLVREHAKQGGFPADVINKVACICDPVNAE